MLERALTPAHMAVFFIKVEEFKSKNMQPVRFVIDTGATSLVIPENILLDNLNYDKGWINKNKKELPKDAFVRTATCDDRNFYVLPAPRINLGGYIVQTRQMLVNKIDRPHALFGMDVLKHFYFEFNCDATPRYKYGQVNFKYRSKALGEEIRKGPLFAKDAVSMESYSLLGYIQSVGGIRTKSLSPTEQVWESCSGFRVDYNKLQELVKAGKVVEKDGCYLPI